MSRSTLKIMEKGRNTTPRKKVRSKKRGKKCGANSIEGGTVLQHQEWKVGHYPGQKKKKKEVVEPWCGGRRKNKNTQET